jgi:signal transduction histidine kinase
MLFDNLSWAQRITVAVLGVAAAALVVFEGLVAPTVPTAVGIVVCGALPLVALFVPKVHPVLVAVVSGAFSIVCSQLPERPENTFGVVELIALSWLIVRVLMQNPLLRSAWQAVLLTIAAALLPLRLGASSDSLRGLMVAAVLMGAAFMALLGMYLRLHDRRRADTYELSRQTQRLEYARDLHDFVAHHVTAIVAQTKAVRFTSAAGTSPSPEALDSMLAGIEQAGSQALESMRGMITVLRGDAPVRPQRTLNEVVAVVANRFSTVGPPATVSIEDSLADRYLPQPVIEAAHHVVQESLTNVLRHAADVSRVEIVARVRADLVELSVSNDGHPTETDLPSGGFGLVGLTERVEAVGGRLTYGPADPGWRVVAALPSSGA